MRVKLRFAIFLTLIFLALGWAWWRQHDEAPPAQVSTTEREVLEIPEDTQARTATVAAQPATEQARAMAPGADEGAEQGAQDQSMAARREAYLRQVQSESLSEAFQTITTEWIQPYFSRISLDGGAASHFYPEHALAEFAKDPRAARLMETAKNGDDEDRELLYALAEQEIIAMTALYNDETITLNERTAADATSGLALVSYLLTQSSDDPIKTSALIYEYVAAFQQTYSEYYSQSPVMHQIEVTSAYITSMSSNIAVEMLRNQLLALTSQRETLFPHNSSAQEMLEQYEAFHANVTSRQQQRLQANYDRASHLFGGQIEDMDTVSNSTLEVGQLIQYAEFAASAGEAARTTPVPPSVAGLSGYEAIIEFYRLFYSSLH